MSEKNFETVAEENSRIPTQPRVPLSTTITIVIGTFLSIVAFFIGPMFRNPMTAVNDVETRMALKLDKLEFDKQCSITQSVLDKKVDKDTFTATVAGQNALLNKIYEEAKFTRIQMSKHLEDSKK